MKKLLMLPHFHTGAEVAALLQANPVIIDRLMRCGIHPLWTWEPRWKEPRFRADTIPEWRRILDTVDLDSLPENPPPLERPEETFRESRQGATAEDLAVARKMCGVKQ